SSLWLQRKGCRTSGSTSLDKIQAAYDRKVAAGHLESDKVQRRVLEYLAASLDQAAARAEALARGHAAAVAAASAAAADAAAAAAAEAATIATTTVTTATATTATTSTSSTATPSSATTSSTASSPPATSAPAQNESSASFLVMSGARGDVESVGKHSSWGKPGWVLPKTISGAGLSMAEDHRRVAQYTKQLAAENSRKVRAQADARQAASRGGTAAEQQAVAAPATATAAPSDPQSAPAAEEKAPPKQPVIKRSVYVHGSVGTGKTMMLDLFYDQAREAGLRTVRQHFYEFMIGFHKQIHLFSGDRPVEVAANMLADDIDVLCFDEFQITDIQDATILPRLFEVLFLRGVAVVMTSNTSPQLLYTGGLNRHVHLPPFVSTVGEHCTVLGLGGPGLERVDYRRKAEAAELAEEAAAGAEGDVGTSGAYLWGAGAEERLRLRWEELRVEEGSWPEKVVELQLPMGRTFRVPAAAGKSCLLTFEELCGKDRGETTMPGGYTADRPPMAPERGTESGGIDNAISASGARGGGPSPRRRPPPATPRPGGTSIPASPRSFRPTAEVPGVQSPQSPRRLEPRAPSLPRSRPGTSRPSTAAAAKRAAAAATVPGSAGPPVTPRAARPRFHGEQGVHGTPRGMDSWTPAYSSSRGSRSSSASGRAGVEAVEDPRVGHLKASSPEKAEEDDEEEYLSEDFLRRYCNGADLSEVESLEIRVNSALQRVESLGENLPTLRCLRLSESSVLGIRELGTSLRNLEVLGLAAVVSRTSTVSRRWTSFGSSTSPSTTLPTFRS
ncbi:unnamed protein product, partial [Polarella glacialis]